MKKKHLTKLAFLLEKLGAKVFGVSSWRRQNIHYVATPRPCNSPVIDVSANSRVTVQIPDVSEIGEDLIYLGHNIISD